MAVFIQVLNGPDQGKRFRAQHGLKLGRKKSDFIVHDNGASGHHATIQKKGPDDFYLVDNSSKNGTKVNGKREDVIELVSGTVFTIGKTQFEVVKNVQSDVQKILESGPVPIEEPPQFQTDCSFKFQDNSYESEPKLPEVPTPNNYELPPPDEPSLVSTKFTPSEAFDLGGNSDHSIKEIVEVEVDNEWNQELEAFAQKSLAKIKNKKRPVLPMNPALRLRFVRGVQTDTEWIIGYGPRIVGSDEYDLTIYEPNAPGSCFELIPLEQGDVELKTSHIDKVFVNSKSVNRHVLKEGDRIQIFGTEIVVELIK